MANPCKDRAPSSVIWHYQLPLLASSPWHSTWGCHHGEQFQAKLTCLLPQDGKKKKKIAHYQNRTDDLIISLSEYEWHALPLSQAGEWLDSGNGSECWFIMTPTYLTVCVMQRCSAVVLFSLSSLLSFFCCLNRSFPQVVNSFYQNRYLPSLQKWHSTTFTRLISGT